VPEESDEQAGGRHDQRHGQDVAPFDALLEGIDLATQGFADFLEFLFRPGLLPAEGLDFLLLLGSEDKLLAGVRRFCRGIFPPPRPADV
jgi:hypothetical protein